MHLEINKRIYMLKKQCAMCKQNQPTTEFSPLRKAKDGFKSICKACSRVYALEYQNSVGRFKKYGVTKDDYDFMFLEQRGKCRVCETALQYSGKSTHIDHCHSSGKVRGLLCVHCNLLLGYAKDNQIILAKAIEYLKENEDDV